MRAHLVIADIGGYTRFMNAHRFALSHAQQTIADLLTAVIDGARPMFKVAKLEGDAAFLYAVESDSAAASDRVQKQIFQIRQAFLVKQQRLLADNICTCEPCSAIGELKLKFAAHHGEFAMQKVKRYRELAGPDVILVHRMLKNEVPSSEYVLMTDSVLPHLNDEVRGAIRSLEQSFEGFGQVTTHYLDFTQLPPPVLPTLSPSRVRQWVATLTRTCRALPAVLRLSDPRVGEEPHRHV